MKKSQIITFLICISFFYPFGCEAQINNTTPINDSCDTIYIEDPEKDSEIKAALDQNEKLVKDLAEKGIIISTQANEISSLKSELTTKQDLIDSQGSQVIKLESDIVILNSDIVKLENLLAVKPDTIFTETEADYITVNGIQHKVSEIEQILPNQTVDTIQVTWCTPDPKNRKYWHEGNIDVYPHFVNFATKEKGMIKVYFNTPLDTIIKRSSILKLQRIRSHKQGISQYDYISSN